MSQIETRLNRLRMFTIDPNYALTCLNAGHSGYFFSLPVNGRFPEDARVIEIAYSLARRAFEVLVWSSEYPPVAPGALIPMAEDHHIPWTELSIKSVYSWDETPSGEEIKQQIIAAFEDPKTVKEPAAELDPVKFFFNI